MKAEFRASQLKDNLLAVIHVNHPGKFVRLLWLFAKRLGNLLLDCVQKLLSDFLFNQYIVDRQTHLT